MYFANCILRLSVLLYAKSCTGNQDPPNIIFILADDLGFNDIGYHARQHRSDMKTPFIDKLASGGIKLENYYVQPVCTPTRSQLMSGRHEIHTGLQHRMIMASQANALPIENKILPEQLKSCGYETHMVGKWHLGFYKSEFLPWRRGFDSYFGFPIGAEDYYTHSRCFRGLCGLDMYSSTLGPVNDTWGEYSTHLFTRKAIETIDNRDPEKPFFLYLACQSVHAPLQVPENYLKPFQHIKNKRRRKYAGMVLAMDESISNITRHLVDSDLMDNTIIVFSTNNGGYGKKGGNNWPLRGGKGTLWEGGVCAAGFIYGKPLGLSGVTHKGLLHVSDWFPTLLGAAKCQLINGTQPLDGFNQWDAMRQKVQSPRTELLHNIDPMNKVRSNQTASDLAGDFDIRVHAAIRSGAWKLLTGDPGYDEWVKPPEYQQNVSVARYERHRNGSLLQLFNIEKDPYEHRNVAFDNPTIVEHLLQRLAMYQSSAVPLSYPKFDPKSDPKFHGGYWSPWMDK